MLDYEWGNPSPIMLSGDDPTQETDQTRHIFDHYNQTLVNDLNGFTPHHHLFHPQTQTHSHYSSLYDGASFSPPPPTEARSFEPVGGATAGQNGTAGVGVDFMSRIGLNLGGRTYFSSSTEEDFVNRLYRRSRTLEPGSASSPRCQVEGCNADLTHAKHYHRRHKVCEFHSKAATVVAARLTQRFCQQCSRFHLLSEFDNGKRSCRKRLADHNRRRRKCQQPNKPQLENAPNSSSQNLARSRPDSSAHLSSSVTLAISPPWKSLECFRERSNQTATTSTSSLLFSNGKMQ